MTNANEKFTQAYLTRKAKQFRLDGVDDVAEVYEAFATRLAQGEVGAASRPPENGSQTPSQAQGMPGTGHFGATASPAHPHYFKDVSKLDAIDVYRVLELFDVTNPSLQHAIKKLLVAGGRGQKDIGRDVQEAIDSLNRWKGMRDEDRVCMSELK
jgi:hypothetical protein